MELQNPSNEWQHSLEERKSHRAWIIGRALTLLSHYFRDDDPVELTSAIGRDWADVLEGLPQKYIQLAVIKYQQQNPTRKPTPALIYSMTRELMPRPSVTVTASMPTSASDRQRVTKEAAAEIMTAAGFRPKTFLGGSKNAE